jgi:hypothetical protein
MTVQAETPIRLKSSDSASSRTMNHIAPHITTHSGRNTLHRIFRFKWSNPSASNQEIADALHITPNNVKVTIHRLRKLDLTRRCPECWCESLFGDICQACGFEPSVPDIPAALRFDEQSPTNHLHSGNQLGSEVDYNDLRVKGVYGNDGLLLKQRMDRAIEDSLTRDVKAQVMQDLKAYYPTEAITDYAGRLCIKEVLEFRARYPLLAASKNVRKQLAINVMKRLEFLYPALCRPHLREVTRLQEVSEG